MNSILSKLAPLSVNVTNLVAPGLLHYLQDYIELVEWKGQAARNDKHGSIESNLSPILERIELNASNWITFASGVDNYFGNWAGSPEQFSVTSTHVGQ